MSFGKKRIHIMIPSFLSGSGNGGAPIASKNVCVHWTAILSPVIGMLAGPLRGRWRLAKLTLSLVTILCESSQGPLLMYLVRK